MTNYTIETEGLKELTQRMQAFPTKLKQVQDIGMKASLNVLWENVPPYPPQNPETIYRRTGTLGRTLGSSEQGGSSSGKPDIFQVRKLGSTEVEGRFGTRLNYAPYVIGPSEGGKGERQAWMHKGHWWQLVDIIPKAQEKIVKIWEGITKQLANFLDGRSSGL